MEKLNTGWFGQLLTFGPPVAGSLLMHWMLGRGIGMPTLVVTAGATGVSYVVSPMIAKKLWEGASIQTNMMYLIGTPLAASAVIGAGVTYVGDKFI